MTAAGVISPSSTALLKLPEAATERAEQIKSVYYSLAHTPIEQLSLTKRAASSIIEMAALTARNAAERRRGVAFIEKAQDGKTMVLDKFTW